MKRLLPLLSALAQLSACGDGSQTEPEGRLYTFRAIGGASMGAMSAAQLGLRFHEMFDIIAPSGGALDLGMLIHWFQDGMLGGFCVPPELGRMCPKPGQTQDYEHMDCGGPMGGGFDRESIIDTFQDMFVAYGNLASFNPRHPYLPAGMTPDFLELSRPQRCAQPLRLEHFYDWEFNPEGAYPVTTYCEGDGPEQGLFDPSVTPTYPVDISYAVDLNDNGKRDSGEPVIFRLSERYDDFGEDGIPSTEEAGYDAETNPDPHGDDYDPMGNPTGTEDNHLYDPGEPFLDYGLDGVAGTIGSSYDWGEGNGLFDYNPHVLRTAIMFDPSQLLKNLSGHELARLDFYIDVGIRDHLGFRPSCEAFAGKLQSRGREVDLRYGYEAILREDYSGGYDVHYIDWDNVGRDLMIIYGKADATQQEIDAGDGGHVGTIAQALYRFFTLMAFVSARWPDGDDFPLNPTESSQVREEHYHSDILDMDRRYFIYLPPGYATHTDQTYPVLYLMHGIGMKAEDLTAAALFADPWMNEGLLQKYIVVFPDGRCTDDCNSGNFFANQMGGRLPPRRYEDSFLQELIPHIESNFRVKRPKTIHLKNGRYFKAE